MKMEGFRKLQPDLGSYIPISKISGTNELFSNPGRNARTCTAKSAGHIVNPFPKDLHGDTKPLLKSPKTDTE